MSLRQTNSSNVDQTRDQNTATTFQSGNQNVSSNNQTWTSHINVVKQSGFRNTAGISQSEN